MLLIIKKYTSKDQFVTHNYGDVSRYEFNENSIVIHFNLGQTTEYLLRSNDGIGTDDWSQIEVSCIRKAMQLG